MTESDHDRLIERIERLNELGIALSAERNPVHLLEQILLGAKDITNADGGTIYSLGEDHLLRFEILRTDSLGLAMGGTSGVKILFPPISLYREDGSPNTASVVASAVLGGETVNIPDAYHAKGFDFSATRNFDAKTGYHSISFLTVPMRDHQGEITGVLQLLNARDATGRVQPFSTADQRLAESLASQAATARSKYQLIDGMQRLLEAFIQLIATAIDEKSPYTGGHCRRVPELTMMLAEAAAGITRGPLKHFRMNEADRHELRLAGWIHDCGKITTPEWIMDKATKLQTIFDRIELLDTRIEVLKRDAEIVRLNSIIAGETRSVADKRHQDEVGQLDAAREFLRRINHGQEAMLPSDQEQVRALAKRIWTGPAGVEEPLLSANEVENLTITRGTLTAAERAIINHHIVVTIHMLQSLPYPKQLRRIPEFAGGHHEHMDGTGYPLGLKREQMSVQARVMGIADVFEALTAGDRPYKKAMKLSQSLHILGRMCVDGHIDPDLFDVFIHEKVYLAYAKRFLPPEQIDEVDVTTLPGYRALIDGEERSA
jgi:HD-GYP domain-containing protein (c-di-GMP phosphodiesterase class II)